jgi:hypothetical protein
MCGMVALKIKNVTNMIETSKLATSQRSQNTKTKCPRSSTIGVEVKVKVELVVVVVV